ncbi:MAG: hypothetical protein H6747_13820 [Deltaproteobacteria bacterium]|nr:hypothetical protein [Deltaproteobacteria bacterium]
MPLRSHALALALSVAFAALFASGCAGEAKSADTATAPCDDIAPLDVADTAEPDAGNDASADAGADTTADAGADTTADAETDAGGDASPSNPCAGLLAGSACGGSGLCDVGGGCICASGTVWNAATASCEACVCDVDGVAVALPVAVTNVYYPPQASPLSSAGGGPFRSEAAMRGGRLAIPNAGFTSPTGAGAVAIHRRSPAGSWQLETTLVRPTDALPSHELHFAHVAALDPSGDALATYSSAGPFNGGGTTSAVRVYQRGAPGVWTSAPPLPLPPNAGGMGMDGVRAASLALDGDWLVVGAPGRTLVQEWGRGSVFFYGRDSAGTWALQQTLHGAASAVRFGSNVDLQGDEVAIAAYYEGGSGAVHIHRHTAGPWASQQTLLAPTNGTTETRLFGVGVARSANRLYVAAMQRSPIPAGGTCFEKVIHIFDRPSAAADFALVATITDNLAPSCAGYSLADDLQIFGDGVVTRALVGGTWGEVRHYALGSNGPVLRWRLPVAAPPGPTAPGQLDPAQPGNLGDGIGILTDGTDIAVDARGAGSPDPAVRVYTLGAGACSPAALCDCAPGYTGPDCATQGCSSAADCDDGNPCTADTCTATVCAHTPVATSTACDDGNACTTGEACSGGLCTPGTALDCDDGDPCNKDVCLPASGCVHITSVTSACDDANACTTNDTCNKKTGCVGTAVDCDDANTCTTDACDPATGCTHVDLANGATCTDGNACTGPDACQSGVCVPSGALTCDDGNPCTADSCDATSGCVHATTAGAFCGGAGLCLADASCDCPAGTVWNAATASCEGCACDVDGVAVALPVPVTNVYRVDLSGHGLLSWAEQASLRAGRLAVCDPQLPTPAGNGGVILYRRDASGGWVHEATLTPPANRLLQENAFAYRAVLARDGNRAVVYSRQLGPNYGYGASAVRVYDRGAPGVWTSSAPLALPAPAFAYDTDGLDFSGLDADGDWLIIGAQQRKQLAADSVRGAVYLLQRDTQGAWSLAQTLWGVDPGGRTGFAVDLQGDEAVVGSPGMRYSLFTANDTFGRVDVLARSGSTWSIAQTLLGQPGNSGAKTGFGVEVARAGDRLYVGTIRYDGCGSHGSVRAFQRTTAGAPFAPLATLFETSPGCSQEFEFGHRFEVFDGGVLVRNAAHPNGSSLRLFDVTASGFSRRWRLPIAHAPGAGAPGQFAPWAPGGPNLFGRALAADGDQIAVGVHAPPFTTDAVRVFELGAGACNPQGLCDCEPGSGGADCSMQLCTSAAACDDGNPCTADACTGPTGQQQCSHTALSGTTANPVPCSDGDACTTGDACTAGACVPGPAPDCDDGDACTADACDPASGCTHAFDATLPCSDGKACTTGDHCDALLGCVGTAVNCDDGNTCTADACVEPLSPNKPPICNHVPTNDYAPCNDGDACNVGEVCKFGICMGGSAALCDDGDACTIDSCDPASGCTATPTNGPGCGVLAACDPNGSVPMFQEVTTALDPGPVGAGIWTAVPTTILLRGDWLFRGWSSPGANPAVERVTIHRRVAGAWTEVQQLTPPAGGTATPSHSRFADALAANADASLLVVADGPRRRLLTATRDGNGVYAWQPGQTIANPLGLQNPVLHTVSEQRLGFDGTTLVLHTLSNGTRFFRRVGSAWQGEAGSSAGAPDAFVGLGLAGRSAALDGDAVLLGSPFDVTTLSPPVVGGRVARYVRSGSTWGYAGAFGHPAPKAGASFGHALARSGDRLAVGVPQADCGGGTGGAIGGVAIFVRAAGNPAGWQHHHDLTAASTIGCGHNAKLGTALAFDGDTLFVGAPRLPAPNVPGALGAIARLAVAADGSTTLLQLIQPSALLPPIFYAVGTVSDQQRFGAALTADADRLATWLPMATSDSRPSRTVLLEPMPGTADAAGSCACLPGYSGPTCSTQACSKLDSCDDGNPCTQDACQLDKGTLTGTCAHTPPASKFVPCDDGDACTELDLCQSGACVGTQPKECNDGKFCTADECDSQTGQCVSLQVPGCKG